MGVDRVQPNSPLDNVHGRRPSGMGSSSVMAHSTGIDIMRVFPGFTPRLGHGFIFVLQTVEPDAWAALWLFGRPVYLVDLTHDASVLPVRVLKESPQHQPGLAPANEHDDGGVKGVDDVLRLDDSVNKSVADLANNGSIVIVTAKQEPAALERCACIRCAAAAVLSSSKTNITTSYCLQTYGLRPSCDVPAYPNGLVTTPRNIQRRAHPVGWLYLSAVYEATCPLVQPQRRTEGRCGSPCRRGGSKCHYAA
jgi:hypothetical protein